MTAIATAACSTLFCSFEPDELESLEALSVGDVVTLSGAFSKYRDEDAGLAVRLNHCGVED